VKTKEIDLERLASEASVTGGSWGGGSPPEDFAIWRLGASEACVTEGYPKRLG
jgi:hypothetical protein